MIDIMTACSSARGSTSRGHKVGDRHNVSLGSARGSTSQGHKVGAGQSQT